MLEPSKHTSGGVYPSWLDRHDVRTNAVSDSSPSSATRRQKACNVLIFRSRKPKVGTTRHRAGERGRGTQTSSIPSFFSLISQRILLDILVVR